MGSKNQRKYYFCNFVIFFIYFLFSNITLIHQLTKAASILLHIPPIRLRKRTLPGELQDPNKSQNGRTTISP